MGWLLPSYARGVLWAMLLALVVACLPRNSAQAQDFYTPNAAEGARLCAKDHLIGYDKDYGPDDVDHKNFWGIVMKDGKNIDAMTFLKMKYRLAHCPNANDVPQGTSQNSGLSESSLAALYNRRVNTPVEADQTASAAPVANAADEAAKPAPATPVAGAANERVPGKNDPRKVGAENQQTQTAAPDAAPAHEAGDVTSADTPTALPQETPPMTQQLPVFFTVAIVYAIAIMVAYGCLSGFSFVASRLGALKKAMAKDGVVVFNVHGEFHDDAEHCFRHYDHYFRAVMVVAGAIGYYMMTSRLDSTAKWAMYIVLGAGILAFVLFGQSATQLARWQFNEGMGMQYLKADNGEYYRLLCRKEDGDFLYDPASREDLLRMERLRRKIQVERFGITFGLILGAIILALFLGYFVSRFPYGNQISAFAFALYAVAAFPFCITTFWVSNCLTQGNQYFLGARTDMPKPDRKTRADIMAQGSHGKARFATAAEAARMGT